MRSTTSVSTCRSRTSSRRSADRQPEVVGLSGLLTLAFDAMKDTVEGIAAAGLRDQVKIMIGGSPVDEQVCVYAAADGWGRDAAAALRLAAEWTGGAA